jgi:hypothetical protein
VLKIPIILAIHGHRLNNLSSISNIFVCSYPANDAPITKPKFALGNSPPVYLFSRIKGLHVKSHTEVGHFSILINSISELLSE